MIVQENFLVVVGFDKMSDSERTVNSRSSSDKKFSRLSPATSRELKQVMNQTLSERFDSSLDIFPGGDTSGLKGEALREFKRRRNAFHSRKKRRRKKEFVERLQFCFERVSEENKRLKREHSFLNSTVEHALRMVNRIETERRLDTRNSLPGRELFSIDPNPIEGYSLRSLLGQTLYPHGHEYLDPSVVAVAAAVRRQEELDAARRAASFMQVAPMNPPEYDPFRRLVPGSALQHGLGAGNQFVPFAETQTAFAQQQALQSALEAENERQLQFLSSLHPQQYMPYGSMLTGVQQPFTSSSTAALNRGRVHQQQIRRNDSNSPVFESDKMPRGPNKEKES